MMRARAQGQNFSSRRQSGRAETPLFATKSKANPKEEKQILGTTNPGLMQNIGNCKNEEGQSSGPKRREAMNEMKRCPKCGRTLDTSLDYCPSCGAYLLEPLNINQSNKRRRYSTYQTEEPVSFDDVCLGIALTLLLSYIGFLIAVVGFKDRRGIKNGAIGTVVVITVGYVLVLLVFCVLHANGVI